MKQETYHELKARHSSEYEAIEGVFYAFSQEQLEEGMKKIGLTMDDLKLVCAMGSGGYMLKSQVDEMLAMMKRHEAERKAMKKSHKALLDGLVYELGNHEYCYTGNATEAIEAMGYEKGDLPPGLLAKAIKIYDASIDYDTV